MAEARAVETAEVAKVVVGMVVEMEGVTEVAAMAVAAMVVATGEAMVGVVKAVVVRVEAAMAVVAMAVVTGVAEMVEETAECQKSRQHSNARRMFPSHPCIRWSARCCPKLRRAAHRGSSARTPPTSIQAAHRSRNQ